MGVLSLLTGIREIKKAVVGDLMGTLLATMGDSKGEVVAAVMGFALTTMSQAGDSLGLGTLQRVCFTAKKETCIVTLLDRLLHHADVTVIEGESYRVRESEQETAARRRKK